MMRDCTDTEAELMAALRHTEGWVGEDTLCRLAGCTGPELADRLHGLSEAGYPVRWVPGLGARWKPRPEEYDPAELAALSGMQVRLFAETGSTNDIARQLLDRGCTGPVLVVADTQTAGRGRLGRSFASPGGEGIYMSLLLTDPRVLAHPGQITAAAAVLVEASIRELTGVQTRIKWINDLYLGGRKLCGILTEGVTGGDGLAGVVVGIGINFRTDLARLPEEVACRAATLAGRLPAGVTRSDLIGAIARAAAKRLPGLLETGGFLPEYRQYSCVLGRRVRVLPAGGEPYQALAVAIDDDAALIVQGPQGQQRLSTGEISIRFLEDAPPARPGQTE